MKRGGNIKGLLSSLLDYIEDFFSFFSDTALPSIKNFFGVVKDAAAFIDWHAVGGNMVVAPLLTAFFTTVITITIIKLVVNR